MKTGLKNNTFLPHTSRPARPSPCGIFVSPHSSMVLILCKTALISGTPICSRPINHLSIFQYFNISIFQSFNKFSLLYFQLNNPPFKETLKSHPRPMKCQSEFDTLTLTPHPIFPYQYHDFNKSTCPYAPPQTVRKRHFFQRITED